LLFLHALAIAPEQEGVSIRLDHHGKCSKRGLFEYSAATASDEASPPTIPAGPLVVGDRDSQSVLQTLSSILGINLADPSLSFVLVQRKRQAGSATHVAVEDGGFTGWFRRSNVMKQKAMKPPSTSGR
jgi:hypothetical protein